MKRTKTKARYRNLSATSMLPEIHEGQFARTLILAILTAMLTLFAWSAITPVNEITTGNGTIQTTALSERVEHPDGGVVAAIHVRSGDVVEAQTILMTFDTSSLKRELEKLTATKATLDAERRRIDFILSGSGSIPEFTDLADLSAEELLFWAEQSFLEAQLQIFENERQAAYPTIASLKARRDSLTRELALLGQRLERTREGLASGAISLNAVIGIEREYLQLERAIFEVDGDVAAQTAALEANALRAKELIARRNHEAALRRAEIDDQIFGTAVTIAEYEARIARAVVRSAVAGTVMELTVSNPQEVVAPGDLIAEIIPAQDQLNAEVQISADRIGNVETGMTARLKVLSYDFTRYGEIVGTVSSVSPSSFVNDLGETVFRVTIELPDAGQSPRIADRAVLPGMTVTADILSDSKKVLTYLLKPLRALGDRAFTEA